MKKMTKTMKLLLIGLFGKKYKRAQDLECHYIIIFSKTTRSQRLRTNKFALVSKLKLLQKPNINLIVNEQLFPTKTKCRFIQYMPDKPDKFEIKFSANLALANVNKKLYEKIIDLFSEFLLSRILKIWTKYCDV
ncbi:LOW QUALITY PROTEIN: piggyBac transposable element-derived protein 4-like [Vespula squamosa]|uniref:PiggyBac transposable element-derived protein 4-like n=1 Tax=Vespula squamosa TaxID=30214 RepID=A0ABD2BG96_VESSQ